MDKTKKRSNVVDRYRFDADPDPNFNVDADLDPDLDPDWRQNNADSYADPIPKF